LPVHNGARFLPAAIDSVLAQTLADLELICVDDASHDESPAILARYAAADPRVRVITLAQNKGLPAALNVGFAAARGTYHGWTSDDNVLRPAMLATLAGVLDANADVDIVHSAVTFIDGDDNVTGTDTVGPATRLLHGNNIGASFLYRAAVTEALGGYDEGLFGVEDYDFWLRAARRFTFRAIPDNLYLYRKHGGSLTSQRAAHIHRLAARIVQRELDRAPGHPERADILLALALRSRSTWRIDLVLAALRARPALVLANSWRIARWTASVARHRIFG
jgi:glycosyltransferase involved in cell wall biosynthesis